MSGRTLVASVDGTVGKKFERENEEWVDIEEFWNTQQQWCYRTSDGKMHWYGVYPVLKGHLVEFPWMYYINADSVAAREYVFRKMDNWRR